MPPTFQPISSSVAPYFILGGKPSFGFEDIFDFKCFLLDFWYDIHWYTRYMHFHQMKIPTFLNISEPWQHILGMAWWLGGFISA
jgi:hypothetical protein